MPMHDEVKNSSWLVNDGCRRSKKLWEVYGSLNMSSK